MRARGTKTMLFASVMLLAGCGSDGPDLDDDAIWRTSTSPVVTGGLAWATGSTVHLSDGSTIDTGEPVRGFLVAGDGVFYVPSQSAQDSMQFSGTDLFFAAPDQASTNTGLSVSDTDFAASPDGRHLTFLEADGDDGSAVMRFFDLSSGETFTSSDGMDTSDYEDPVDHLLEMEVEILAINDREVYARVIQGDYAYDLASGRGRPIGESETIPGYGGDELVSPDGAWRIVTTPRATDWVVGTDGKRIVPAAGSQRWQLGWWADDSTVVGSTIQGPGRGDSIGPGDSTALMSCAIPTGRCEVFAETTGQDVLFPIGSTFSWAATYRDGTKQRL